MERFKIYCAVHLMIIKDSKILLQRRINPNKYGYLKLGIPAGHLEENENPLEAMIREAKEELNIDLIDFELVQIMNVNGGTGVYDSYFFICNDYKGTITNNEKDDSKELEWHSIDEPIEDLMDYQQYALDIYKKNPSLTFTMFGWDKD